MFETIKNSFQGIIQEMLGIIPGLMGALMMLLIGWILAKFLMGLVKRLLTQIKLDSLVDKLDLFGNMNISLTEILSTVVYWLIMLIFLMSATDVLGLAVISEGLKNLIGEMPRLFSALLVFGMGLYLASIVKKFVASAAKSFGIAAWQVISTVLFYFLVIIISVTSLEQAGIDTSLVQNNEMIILLGVALAFAIAYGYAARGILTNILSSIYTKKNFRIGQIIEVDGYKGRIVKMDNVSFTLHAGDKYVVFPLQRLVSDKIVVHIEKPQ